MSCPGTLDPPQAQRATRSLFIKFAYDQTDLLIIGLRSETDPPQHLPAALALEGILNTLSKAAGTSPIKLTPTVAQALQAPPHGLSERAVSDLKALLRKFLQVNSSPLRHSGKQRRYAPIPISPEWMFEAVPQFQFRRSTEAERQAHARAEVERQALRAMSYNQRRRYHSERRHLPISSPNKDSST